MPGEMLKMSRGLQQQDKTTHQVQNCAREEISV